MNCKLFFRSRGNGTETALTVQGPPRRDHGARPVGSGAKTRPRREELLRAARRREIDVIVVWRLDRRGRSLVDLVATLQELTALKVGFVSLSEALDLTTPSVRSPGCWRSLPSSSATFCATW
jgi:hypothetical protein